MNVLMMGLDPSPVLKSGMGDINERLKTQGTFLEGMSYICRSPRPAKPVKLSKNVNVYPISPILRPLYPLYALKTALAISKKEKIDVVYTQDPFFCGLGGYFFRKLYDARLVIGLHSNLLDDPNWLKEERYYPLMNALGRMLIKKADKVRAVSKSIGKKLLGMGIDEEGIVVAPTGGGVNVKLFSSGDGKRIRAKYRGKKLLLFVGRIAKAKNLDMMLEAAEVLKKDAPNCLLLIIGDGPEKERLTKKACEMNLENVVFLGHVPFGELVDYYAACDACFLTSNYEGLPKTLEESFAAGKPFISTNVSGCDEMVIEGKTGYLVGVGDSHAFAEKTVELLSDKKNAEKLGRNGKAFVGRYYNRDKNFKDMYLKIYS